MGCKTIVTGTGSGISIITGSALPLACASGALAINASINTDAASALALLIL